VKILLVYKIDFNFWGAWRIGQSRGAVLYHGRTIIRRSYTGRVTLFSKPLKRTSGAWKKADYG
jgi:hypothetical protein